jgi:outer membrane protein assembly factor BamA
VVQRQLLFSPGDRIDTTLVAETLRRLRDRRLYTDVIFAVRRCAGSDSVDLLVTTRDAWTLRPIARIVPPNTISTAAEDRNL